MRDSYWDPISQTHQGQWPAKPIKDSGASRNESPNVLVQSDPASPHELKTWQTGRCNVLLLGTGGNGSDSALMLIPDFVHGFWISGVQST